MPEYYPPPEEYEAQKARMRAARFVQIAVVIAIGALALLYWRLTG